MSEQAVNPEGGTEQDAIVDEQSAVDAIARRLEPEEANREAQEQAEDDNLSQEDHHAETGEAEDDGEATSEPEVSDDSVELPQSLPELIEALGVEPEALMNLKTTVKIDGKATEVTLSEAIAGYQKDADYRQKTESLATQRREFEARQQQAQAEFQQRAQHVDTMIQALSEEIGSVSEADLAYLLEENPAEYIRQTNAIKARHTRLEQFQRQRAQMFQQEQQEMQQKIAEYRRSQQQALMEKVPGIDNPEKGNVIQKQVVETLGGFGYSADEVQQYMAGPYDHRLIMMALELNTLRQKEAKGKEAVKKIALKPKVSRPGAATQQKNADEQQTELRNRLRRHGRDPARSRGASEADAVAYVRNLL